MSARAWSRVLPWTRILPTVLIDCGVRPMWPMTGMPARTSVSMTRAVRTPPSTLTAWAPASRRKIPAFSSASSGVAYDRNGMSADDQRPRRAADDGLGVVDHLGHRHAHGRLVAEDDLPERVADEEHRDAGLVEDPGGRVVVGGQHRDRARRRRTAWRCRRRSGGGRSRVWRSCWLPCRAGRGASLRGGVALVQRGRHPIQQPVGDGALRLERQVLARRRRRPGSTTRFVSVPKPEPASATSLATRRSTPLRRSFSAARSSEPVSAAKPTRIGHRPERLAGRRPVAVEAAGDPADLGQQVRCRLELEGQRVGSGELAVGRGDRPEVGDGRGHDERVEPGRAVRRRGWRAAARPAGRRSTRPGRRSRPAAGRPRRWRPRPSRARPRSSAASAIAAPIFPVERLPMKRTGSIASRVPPAVTTTWRPARSASRAGATSGGRAAGSGARTGRSAMAATTASTIAGSSARRPTPDCPEASGPASGSTIV